MSESKHAVVTGASRGIGEALARALSGAGYDLTLIARSAEKLESLAAALPTRCHVVALDLSNPDDAASWNEATKKLGPIDVLVNNAGMQIVGPTADVDVEAGEKLLRLNVMTPFRMTRAVLPAMLARSSGTIVDIASMAALAPTAGMYYYNASKAGMAAASEALRGELRGSGVHVVTVYPGIIETQMGKAGLAAYKPSRMLGLQPRGTTEKLASLVLKAVRRRKARVIYPAFNASARHLPGLTRWLMDRFTPQMTVGEDAN